MAIQLWEELPKDRDAIRHILREAFQGEDEIRLVDAIRQSSVRHISLVAEMGDGELVGHILFSAVTVAGFPAARIAGLAPMAVLPAWQRRGVGSTLIVEGAHRCLNEGYDGVVVLGHPGYYKQLGFAPASTFGLKSEYDVPDGVFMARELIPNGLATISGTVQYSAPFNEP